MKNLTLIVHADVQRALADTLHGFEQVSAFIFTKIEGHSPQDESDRSLSARDRVIGYTPHVRVDILLKEDDVDKVLQALGSADCGLTGRCTYQVTAVEKQGAL